MIEGGGGVMGGLRRLFSGDGSIGDPEEPGTDLAPIGGVLREEEFSAYAEDCRLFGFLRTDADRLTDALNADERYQLIDVLVIALADDNTSEARELEVARGELIAVRAAGPRGNTSRRTRTRPTPVVLKAGPYVVRGYLHVTPGADAVRAFRSRKTWVPLTSASIEYTSGGTPHRARVGTIIVNRQRVDWIDSSKDADIRVDLPVETRIDPRAKDLTGSIRVSEVPKPDVD